MKARLHRPTPANLRRLATVLRDGGLVAIPTETVYGLAAHALDTEACRAIFRAKGRPAHDPLIVHVLDLAHAVELAEFNDPARRLVQAFWPGALTLVLPKKACVPDIVTSGGPTVALRSPAHPLARRLLKLAGVPLAAPSANPFTYISPTTVEHVRQGLGARIPHILDGGACPIGVESTVLDLSRPGRPRVLRPGAISAEQISRVLGTKVATVRRAGKPGKRLLAPGLLDKHYSPRTPLRAVANPATTDTGTAVILLRKPAGQARVGVYWLSRRGELSEIARHLYRVLREADASGHHQILIEKLPPTAGGLAAAINDRVKRAAAKR
ncbi:threonylcarbamoyl-AMP synthase [Oleiharenicola lentus]|uniref:Threonylcarbamoyl-AMP synthase n=1 Tax=Oleiharenicola lentus TaxID=2508720 RepID=A0A4Q1C7H4_9BACT|nr:L-threonylcarbamoyladenylate synthase [Oleiharenicola lentus]RXK54702.1 threonylcarbamoyl-AMP synthase [Oleiharenicola lentus]